MTTDEKIEIIGSELYNNNIDYSYIEFINSNYFNIYFDKLMYNKNVYKNLSYVNFIFYIDDNISEINQFINNNIREL